MQNDLVQPKLTVLEAMSFAADLKVGKRKSRPEKLVVVSTFLTPMKKIFWWDISKNKLQIKISYYIKCYLYIKHVT